MKINEEEKKIECAPESLYEALVRSTDDFVYFCDWKKGEFHYPREMVHLFGLPGEVVREPLRYWKEIIHPDDWMYFYQSNIEIGEKGKDSHSVEFRARMVQGEYIWMRCRGNLIRDCEGNPELFAGIIQRMGRQNKIDPVTQLFNFQEFLNTIRTYISTKQVEHFGIMILDIDNFRLINEMYSREMGDNVLRTVSRFIQAMLPENAALYRLDKDRMGILAGYVTKCEMLDLYQRIQKMLLQITEWRAYGFKVEVSAGCSGYPQDGCMVNELLQYAEYALLDAKKKGKNTISFFNESMLRQKKRSLELIRMLRTAIDQDFQGFYLLYQPQIDGKGEQIKGVEALARFQDEEGVPVAVTEFLPILEEHGMIVPFGKWVARTAMQNGKKWLVRNPDFKVSINASALQLMQADFASDILRIAEEEGFPYKNLIVELTESCAVENLNIFMDNFLHLRQMGVHVAMDDFGTGYSSLQMLKDTPVDVVKIDRSFVAEIGSSEFHKTFISFVVSICHTVGIQVCLEGVETQEEFDLVKNMQLDYIQGYFFGRPMEKEKITEIMQ